MAQFLAPYNNGMRLGQGFNSYTQQLCLDHAVLEDTPANRAKYMVDLAKASRTGSNGLGSDSDADSVMVPTGKEPIDEKQEMIPTSERTSQGTVIHHEVKNSCAENRSRSRCLRATVGEISDCNIFFEIRRQDKRGHR